MILTIMHGKTPSIEHRLIFSLRCAFKSTCSKIYRGLDRFEAREQIVADLEQYDLIEKIEPYISKVPRGDRSVHHYEPILTDQWYVKIATIGRTSHRSSGKWRYSICPLKIGKTLFSMDG